jgi:amino-acid N-acetyltransferase
VISPRTPASIRRALPTDAVDIASLIEQYVSSGTLLPRSPEFCAERALEFLVAVIDGRVVGCVHLDEYSPSLAEVRSLVVDPAWQGRGIGSTLVRALEALARVREYALVFAVSNNEEFFRSQGYEPRHIAELDRQRSEISRFKGVYAKDVAPRVE